MKHLLFLIILKLNFFNVYCQDAPSFLDMYWEQIDDCLKSDERLIDISAIQIKRLSRSIIGITGKAIIIQTIEEGFTAEVEVSRKTYLNKYLPVDIPDITSTRHDGCKLLTIEKNYVGKVLENAQVPPECPIKEGTYSMMNSTMGFNLPNFIMPSCYKFQVKLYDKDDKVFMCGNAAIKIVRVGEGPFPRCT